MSLELKKINGFDGVKGPVLTIVMDGIGIAPDGAGNAVKNAYTPTLDMLMEKYPHSILEASGLLKQIFLTFILEQISKNFLSI